MANKDIQPEPTMAYQIWVKLVAPIQGGQGSPFPQGQWRNNDNSNLDNRWSSGFGRREHAVSCAGRDDTPHAL